MENILLSLAFLACPLGMGLMMWFMAKGMRKPQTPAASSPSASVEQLREEHRRLGEEIERLDGAQPVEPAAAPRS
ncbi:MAG: hypothetical protein M3P39_00365 [Actinomycetota bacterium]|jgi:hypothetical protein|nr:hypothetical protein [Actinomycetota bacterium]